MPFNKNALSSKEYASKSSTHPFPNTPYILSHNAEDKQLQLELCGWYVKQKKNASSKYSGIEV